MLNTEEKDEIVEEVCNCINIIKANKIINR